jgi:hypothetical protein
MSDEHIYFDNTDEWGVEPSGNIAVIANPGSVHPLDKQQAFDDYPTICGECISLQTQTCGRCFWLPVLLIHDTFTVTS